MALAAPGDRSRMLSFPFLQHKLEPHQLYCLLYPDHVMTRRQERHYYCSQPITSSGASRIADKLPGKLDEAIARNRQIGTLLAMALLGTVFTHEPVALAVPAEINRRKKQTKEGTIAPWSELDYMAFWLLYHLGANPAVSKKLSNELAHAVKDTGNYTIYEATREHREKNLALYAAVFRAFVEKNTSPINPISGALSFPDTGHSLGSQLEYAVQCILNLPVYEVVANADHPKLNEDPIYANETWQLIRQHDPAFTIPLRNLGANSPAWGVVDMQ